MLTAARAPAQSVFSEDKSFYLSVAIDIALLEYSSDKR